MTLTGKLDLNHCWKITGDLAALEGKKLQGLDLYDCKHLAGAAPALATRRLAVRNVLLHTILLRRQRCISYRVFRSRLTLLGITLRSQPLYTAQAKSTR